jgi:hypothetical protein
VPRHLGSSLFFVFLLAPLTFAITFAYFLPPRAFTSGGYGAESVAVADVNGDGKPDLIVASFCSAPGDNCGLGDGVVSMLLGNGDGTFQAAQIVSGVNGNSIAVADVNRDGKPDLLVGNDSEVNVLLGNGDGTFQPAQAYASGGNSIAVADLNKDSKPDLLLVSSAGTISVLLGNGDGSFQTGKTYATGGSLPVSIAVADVNQDNAPDLVITYFYGQVGVLLGNGDGTFQAARLYASGGGFNARSTAVADVNGDSKPDLLVANRCVSNNDCRLGGVGVLLGNGDGTFQTAHTYASGGEGAAAIAVEDVNGDGKPDLVVANNCLPGAAIPPCSPNYQGAVGLLLGNGDGTFQVMHTYSAGGNFAVSVVVADVNSDGKPDLLVTNSCVSSNNCVTGSVGVLLAQKYPTTTSVITSTSSSFSGQPVAFTATVSSSYGPIPDGESITFYANLMEIGTSTTENGVAIFQTSTLKAGIQNIRAVYSGDRNFKRSFGAVTQMVELYASTISLSSSPNPSTHGHTVQLTAKVSSNAPQGPTGTVTFKQGDGVIGKATLNGGVAIFNKEFLSAGIRSLSATYDGDAQSAKSTSSPVLQVVN